MVRNYKRKTDDKWSKEELLEALIHIKEAKVKINDAAKHYGISRATLYRQYQKFVLSGCKYDVSQFKTCGGNPILTRVEEDVLEKTIKDLRDQGFTVSSSDIKRICFEYCDSNGIPNQFNQDKRMASDDWYYGFLKRHPEIRMTNGKPGSSSGATSSSEATASTPSTTTTEKPSKSKKTGATLGPVKTTAKFVLEEVLASPRKATSPKKVKGSPSIIVQGSNASASVVKKPLKRLGGKSERSKKKRRVKTEVILPEVLNEDIKLEIEDDDEEEEEEMEEDEEGQQQDEEDTEEMETEEAEGEEEEVGDEEEEEENEIEEDEEEQVGDEVEDEAETVEDEEEEEAADDEDDESEGGKEDEEESENNDQEGENEDVDEEQEEADDKSGSGGEEEEQEVEDEEEGEAEGEDEEEEAEDAEEGDEEEVEGEEDQEDEEDEEEEEEEDDDES